MEDDSSPKTAIIARGAFDLIVAHAQREFPFECCGFILEGPDGEEARPIANIQNAKHAEDPARFARDARTAFLMDPKEHLAALKEIDARKLRLKAVYHSHPDHDAYFSATDRAQACSFDPDEPDYPETIHIVLSVRGGRFARAAVFGWDAKAKDFVEMELRVS